MANDITGLEQRRLTVRALELLGEAYDALAAGDTARCDALTDQADPLTVLLLIGGMRIGEIPADPHSAEWAEYVAAQQDALARDEEGGEGQ
jgi:hypothetical protein